MKKTLLLISLLCFCKVLLAQPLIRQMKANPIVESEKVNREADKSYVHVKTEVPNLRFDSNNKIISSSRTSAGDYDVWLSPGTHILKIDADGFQTLELQRFTFAKKRSYELVITARGFSPTDRADENLIELRFMLNQENVYSSYGDFAPMLSKEKTISYKLPKGSYTFRFWKQGFIEQTRTVVVNQSEEITLELVSAGSGGETKKIPLPGFVRVSTTPSGAEILINGQKMGSSPSTIELTAGAHQIELRKPLYHADVSSFSVEEGKSVSVSRTLKPRFGYLTLTSETPNNVVSLDGKEIGRAPITKKDLESGRHLVKVTAQLYHLFEQEIEIKDNEELTLSANLKPAFGTLEVLTAPERDADVYLDGNHVGTSPYKNLQLPSGKYVLKVTKLLYSDYEEEIVITDGNPTKKEVVLQKNFGELTINAPQSDIYVDGVKKNAETFTARLKPGNYRVSAERQGPFKPVEENIYLAAGDAKTITLTPEGRMGNLTVKVEPYEAGDAEIFFNNELKGNAPRADRVLMGEYNVTAKKTGFLEVTKNVTVKENETAKLEITMLTYAGSRQAAIDRWGTYKIISGIGCIAAGGAAYYFNTQSSKYYDDYTNAATTDDAVSARENTESNDKLFRIALGAAGGFLTGAIVSWIVQATY